MNQKYNPQKIEKTRTISLFYLINLDVILDGNHSDVVIDIALKSR